MALNKDVIKLLLDQQREFMEEQKKLREAELNQHKEDRKDDMKKLEELISNMKDEMKSQVNKLEEKQTEAIESVKKDVDKTKDRQDSADEARQEMLTRIDKLEVELVEMKTKEKEKPKESSAEEEEIAETEETRHKTNRLRDLVNKNRRIIGLSPIDKDDVRRQGQEHDTEDENEMFMFAYKEYMRYELKVQKETIENLAVARIFRDDRDDFDRLYVEFVDESSVKLCFRHTPKMRKDQGVRLITYISPELSQRNQALIDHAYPLRYPKNGEEKLKTRIKYGEDDLILEAKRPDERRYRSVRVGNLPEVDFSRTSFPPPISKSPAEGRNRTAKRIHSPPSPSGETRSTKAAKVDERPGKETGSTPPLRTQVNLLDIGRFSLTNSRSPSLTFNKSKSIIDQGNQFMFSPVKNALKPSKNVK